jgi:hypothetical protein
VSHPILYRLVRQAWYIDDDDDDGGGGDGGGGVDDFVDDDDDENDDVKDDGGNGDAGDCMHAANNAAKAFNCVSCVHASHRRIRSRWPTGRRGAAAVKHYGVW